MSDGSLLTFRTRASLIRPLGKPYDNWDAEKTYRVPVILIAFPDCNFTVEDPQQYYDSLFNETGFNRRSGKGCVAEYFRDQSRGQFNVKFDVVGPVRVSTGQKSSGSYGTGVFKEAVSLTNDVLNYADYDWYGNGRVDVVIFVYAGYGGNETKAVAKGCIWPNTSSFSTVSLDGVSVSDYSASPELWSNDALCGVGTICHEFCHVLGLPDLYPTSGDGFSVLDEWDLMDGGNYSDDGWCPPNLSIHEREYLGWQSPEELTVSRSIMDMPSFSSSGRAYRVTNDANPSEYYLLENRQWDGWDYMLPNHGLLITHVDFDKSAWLSNTVNTRRTHYRVAYFNADGLDYNYYDTNWTGGKYGDDGRTRIMRNTTYPYTDSLGVVHNELTATSTPAATVFHAGPDGSLLMGKLITDIREADGLVSFRFFASVDDGINVTSADVYPVAYYDLRGCKLVLPPESGLYIIKYSDGSTKKMIR